MWGWVDGETQFGFTAVIYGQTLKEQRSKTGTGTTTDGIEAHKTLKTGAVIGQFTKTVQDEIDNFFTDGVVTTGVIIGGIFFTGNDLFRVEQLTVGTSTDFVGDGWFKIDEDATRDVFACTSFGEKGVEGIVSTADGFVGWHLAVRLNTVLEAVKFPAGITHLETGLTDVN